MQGFLKKTFATILWLSAVATVRAQSVVRYDLYVKDTVVNYTGQTRKAIAINGQIPGPLLEFTEGDTAEIYVHNGMHHETSIHWHGLLLPNEQDGVPYLTTAPIKGHTTHRYRFAIRQSGTYWYHSHTMLQEQSGMYGAFVIHKKGEEQQPEHTLLLSDWSDEKPSEIERSLHYATDWYGIKKGASQSYAQAAKEGQLKTKFANEWKRMNAMDVSDVYYERFFVNGKTEERHPQYKAGDRVRLRIVNGSASTYFWLTYAGGKITVVATDGKDVVPVEVDRLIVGVSETYDVMVTLPDSGMAYEFRATSEDRTGHASFWLGEGMPHAQKDLPRLDYFEGMKMMNGMMTMGGKMKDMGMNMSLQRMDMNRVMYPEMTGKTPGKKVRKKKREKTAPATEHAHEGHDMAMPADSAAQIVTLNYDMLRSPVKTTLPEGPFRELRFELTGNMNRYVWTLDNKTISESDKILIKKGENIRIILYNNSMMRHPMHLHGHYFRVLNSQGEYSPEKNVLDIMPMETDTLEFYASEEYGDWYFHCHILYHMMSGMGRIFSYEDSPPNPQLPNPKKAQRKVYNDDRRFFLGGRVGIESNGSDGEITLSNTRWWLQTEWRLGLNDRHGYESESHIGRYFGRTQFLLPYVGWDFRYRRNSGTERNLFGQVSTKDRRAVFCIGVQYTLPWLVVADLRVDHQGKVRLQISREDIPITARLRLSAMFNTDFEYMVGARYIMSKYISVSTHYDSDMGFGAGFTFSY